MHFKSLCCFQTATMFTLTKHTCLSSRTWRQLGESLLPCFSSKKDQNVHFHVVTIRGEKYLGTWV
jgi:hypothetical protein